MKSLVSLLLLSSTLFAALSEGWEQLFTNSPEKALSTFQHYSATTAEEKAEQLRGIIAVHTYLGNSDSLGLLAAETYSYDNDPLALAVQASAFHIWTQQNKSSKDRSILKVLKSAQEQNTLASLTFAELQSNRYRALGKWKKAQKTTTTAGIISNWKAIGPFENSAGSGYNTVYQPEKEIVTSRTYEGKNRNIVSWFDINSDPKTPWVFLNNHTEGYNNTYYFAASINSAEEQKGYISFGASASFKIFHNGSVVVEDSLFRNTGLNSYTTPVTLAKGVNTFLIKIGYENKKANFAFGLVDSSFAPFQNISQLSEVVSVEQPQKPTPYSYTLMIDTISSMLEERIEKDSTDLSAVSQLISFLLLHDQGERVENVIKTYLTRYPESGYLKSQMASLLLRRGHFTGASRLYTESYGLDAKGSSQWNFELSRLLSEGDRAATYQFLEESPQIHKTKLSYYTAEMTLKGQEGKVAQAMLLLDTISQKFPDQKEAALMLHAIYAEGGQYVDALKVLEKVVDLNMFNSSILYAIGDYQLKSGNSPEALKQYNKVIDQFPTEPRAYFMIATLYTAHRQFELALPYVNKTLELTPNSLLAYRLKGQILQQLGRTDEAIETYQKSIERTDDDFLAWESLRELQGKPSWQALAPVPSYNDVIKEALPWADSLDEPVTILTYNEDIFRYPSKAIRKRDFFVIHLADRNSIEEWQEYAVRFNPDAQQLQILTALTVKEDGTSIPADRNENHLVFKSLEPGDNIVVEYTIEEHQHSGMNSMLYGESSFAASLPAYKQQLRFIHPVDDTIPYITYGEVPEAKKSTVEEFAITSFTAKPNEGAPDEMYTPTEYEGESKIVYSDFTDWSDISHWYMKLIARKGEDNPAIRHLADSLFAGITDPWDKVRKAHGYITTNIAYSFVHFRQSGWIPQSTGEILETRIGDCKDMALLGRTLLRFGDIEAELVLVNTTIFRYTDQAFVGPNFDHAILSVTVDDSTHFIDLTSKNSSLNALPVPDQGAMALMITPEGDDVFTLPLDKPQDRRITRNVEISLHNDGSVEVKTASTKEKVFASMMRNSYRYKSEKKQKSELEEQLQDKGESVSVSELHFEGLDTLSDMIKYKYSYIIDNGVSIGANTALYKVQLPERMESTYFPAIAKRKTPVMLRRYYRSISDLDATVKITYPEEWKLTNVLEDKIYSCDEGTYSLTFKQEGNTITIDRKMLSDFRGIYPVKEFADQHEFLSNVLLADQMELIFTK